MFHSRIGLVNLILKICENIWFNCKLISETDPVFKSPHKMTWWCISLIWQFEVSISCDLYLVIYFEPLFFWLQVVDHLFFFLFSFWRSSFLFNSSSLTLPYIKSCISFYSSSNNVDHADTFSSNPSIIYSRTVSKRFLSFLSLFKQLTNLFLYIRV